MRAKNPELAGEAGGLSGLTGETIERGTEVLRGAVLYLGAHPLAELESGFRAAPGGRRRWGGVRTLRMTVTRGAKARALIPPELSQ